jgi:dihydroorotate dehydrogenase electron transfer subunit
MARPVSAPFGRRRIPVVGRRTYGPYVVLGALDAAARATPGQFYMLAAAERWGGGTGERPYLGRAVSIMRVGEDGLVEFLLEDVGPGTRRLCELDAGEEIAVVGPLGNGFTAPAADVEPLLVGGGIGVAPLVAVQESWGGRALLGFRDGERAKAAELFAAPQIATDDGSVGHKGFVTTLLDDELATHSRPIFACGPPAMLSEVQARAATHEVASQLALEAPMACGFGACYGCVVATVDGYRRVCVDGPVFGAAVLT